MCKIVFSFVVLVLLQFSAFAQEGTSPTARGNLLLEVGLSPFGSALGKTPSTGFLLQSGDGTTVWSAGAEGGYFVDDDLAFKVGLGFTNLDASSFFSYKIGAKYYANSVVPIQVDFSGATGSAFDSSFRDTADPFYLGLQGGYAIFFNDNVALEPALRYNFSLNNNFDDSGLFEVRVG